MKKNKDYYAFTQKNEREINKIVRNIMLLFIVAILAITVASSIGVFKVSIKQDLSILSVVVLLELVLAFGTREKYKPVYMKYMGIASILGVITLMASDAYYGIYITLVLAPVVSCLYFDRLLTIRVSICGYLLMLYSLWIRSEKMVQIAFPDYTRMTWFRSFSLSYTLEYVTVAAVCIAISIRSQKYLENLFSQNERVNDIQKKIICRFADLIEMRDDNTGKHVKRTSEYVKLIINSLQEKGLYKKELDEKSAQYISMAAPLHDIGKIKISDSILKKPGRLDDKEFEIIKTHSAEGCKAIEETMGGIEDEDFVKTAREMALYHHEKWNGKGYPMGIKGEEIPLSARIMAVADVFDALVSKRCYKEPFTIEEAFQILVDSKGEHFDPVLVDVFLENREKIERIMNE